MEPSTTDVDRTPEAPAVLVDRRGSVEIITLNRPRSFNAFTPSMIDELDAALLCAGADRACRAVVLTGAGDRAFCAGVDVKAVAATDDENRRSDRSAGLDPVTAGFENLHLRLSKVVRTIHTLAVPVIAAVNGHAIGGGFAFVAAADMRIGSTNAKFADGFVRRGISGCEMGLSYFLPKVVGPATAFDWMLTGRTIDAQSARTAGLLSDIVDPDDLINRAVDLGDAIAANAPMAISMTKEVMWANLHAASLDHALALESRSQVMTRATADAAEARQAFIDKRPPSFVTSGGQRPVR